jgi:hypothetical protein
LDTPAGEEQFLQFLRSRVGAIADLLKSGWLSAADAANTVKALADLYAADGDNGPPEPSARTGPESAAPQPEPPADVGPDNGGARMPDPSLSDLGLGGMGSPLGGVPDPLSSLASALPAAMGAFPPAAGGAALDPLSGLVGAGLPLAGLASQPADAPHHDSADDTSEVGKTGKDDHRSDRAADGNGTDATGKGTRSAQDEQRLPGPPQPAPAPTGTAGPADAPATSIELPDGSTASAATPAAAQAVKAYLAGTPLDAAYRQAGVDLPPPGTPVTAPIDPSQLAAGDVGVFKDHYVVALGAAKALKDGQVVPLASAASGPDFLGWMRPTPPAAPQPAAAASPVPATTPS